MAAPVSSRSGLMSMPSARTSSTKKVIPACFDASGSDRCQADPVVGRPRERRPDLLAREHVPALDPLRPGAQRGQVGAGARLAEELAPGETAQQGRTYPALLLLSGPVRDEGGEGPGTHGEVGRDSAGVGQLLVDDELLHGRRAPAPRRRPVRHDQAGLGQRFVTLRPLRRLRHLLDQPPDIRPQRFRLLGQLRCELATGAGDGQRGDLLFERTGIPARQQLQVGDGALEVQVRVVLPGEPDAAERLHALLGAARAAGSATEPAMHAARRAPPLGSAPSSSLHADAASQATAAHCSTATSMSASACLTAWNCPDRATELHPHLGILRRRVEAPAGDPGALRRAEREREAPDELVGREHLLVRR